MLAGGPGTLIACERATLPRVPGGIAMRPWKVQYVSRNVHGRAVAVSGIVAVPGATGNCRRPTVGLKSITWLACLDRVSLPNGHI